MSILKQKTINKKVSFSGVGLHSGKKANVSLIPASPNTGILFKRVDIKKNNIINPSINNVSNALFCTTISNEFGVSISTVEHLMAALFIKNIDNLIIEIDNPEVPILDGSSKEFINLIDSAGLDVTDKPIRVIKIEKRIEHRDKNKTISIEPSKLSLEINFEIKYENELIGTQKNIVNVYEDNLKNIYESRTFCLYEDIAKLKNLNLALGGSLKNAIVVKNNEILNDEGLRNDKEFVNHKILDCIGDIYLSGLKVFGKIDCSQGGHKLTNELFRKVLSDKNNYSIIEIKGQNIPHSFINRNQLKSIA